jgi:two-component system response regulator FixJ
MEQSIEIALIDDDEAVLDSTRMLLKEQGIDTRTFGTAENFLKSLDRGLPECIVSDVMMPGLSGIELQAELCQRAVRTPLILITGHGAVSMAVAALKAGAADFIEKPFDVAKLAESIRRAVVAARLTEKVDQRRQMVADRAALLSARQRQVMDLVVEGYSNKQIAAKLGLSPRTVETYRLWIMEKMGAGSLAELVRMATLLTPVNPDA